MKKYTVLIFSLFICVLSLAVISFFFEYSKPCAIAFTDEKSIKISENGNCTAFVFVFGTGEYDSLSLSGRNGKSIKAGSIICTESFFVCRLNIQNGKEYAQLSKKNRAVSVWVLLFDKDSEKAVFLHL